MGENISTIQRSSRILKHVVQICRSSVSPAADGLADGSGERRTSPVNGIEDDRSVVPYSSPKDSVHLRYMYHVSNSVVFVHRAGTVAKGYPQAKLFSKGEPVAFEKEININLVYSSCLSHANEMLLGDPRQADQRTQISPIVIHQSLDPAALSSAQAPSSLSLHELRALDMYRLSFSQNASMRRVYAPSR